MSPPDPTTGTEAAKDDYETAVDSVAIPLEPTCALCTERDWGEFREDGQNPEDDLRKPVHGWPSLAQLMANTPDFATFARFRDLNVKSLLYYQAELTSLRQQLHRIEWRDHRRGNFPFSEEFTANLDFLILSEFSETKKGQRQMKLVRKMRGLLKEYNEELLRFSQVSALPDPEGYNVKSLRTLIGKSFAVRGPGSNTWGDIYQDDPSVSHRWPYLKLIGDLIWPQEKPNDLDLVLTDPPRVVDPITRWVKFGFVPFWRNVHSPFSDPSQQMANRAKDIEAQSPEDNPWGKFRKEDYQKPTLATFSDKKLLRIISVLSTIVACLLPTLAITVLSQLHGLRDLLFSLAGFTCIFAIGLIFFTTGSATKLEVFVASAAFSAVLVVFISTPIIINP